MRSWESDRPQEKGGRGSDSQDRMDQRGKMAVNVEYGVNTALWRRPWSAS